MGNQVLSLSETRLIGKAVSILRILANVRANPEMFPEKDGRVIYSDHFKCKALSKEEILAWQNANDGGLEENRLTAEEFDAMIELSGMVATINNFYEGTENVKAIYYCLSEIIVQNKNSNKKQGENFRNIVRYINTLFEINKYLGYNNSHGTNIMLLMSDLSHELNDKLRKIER